jgi:hypothetical protein
LAVVFGVIFLFALFIVTRVVILRYTANSLVANVTGVALAVAFVAGSIARTFVLPTPESAAPAAAPVSDAAASAGAPVAAAAPTDVTRNCRGVKGSPSPNGFGAFDSLQSDSGAAASANAELAGNVEYEAIGWAGDGGKKSPALGVCLMVDGKFATRARSFYGSSRPDVANAFASPPLELSGFKIVIPPSSLPKGPHHIAVAVESLDGSFALAPHSFDIVIR